MFFIFLLFYMISLFFIFFDLNILFINEEFLIFICMSVLFILLTFNVKKFIKFNLFFRIEFIYFFFIYLIILNIKLIIKLLDFIFLENLKLNSLILSEVYNFYNESLISIINSGKFINLFLLKNIILLLNSNIYFSYLFTTSFNFFLKLIKVETDFFQYVEVNDINYTFFIKIVILHSLLKELGSSFLYNLYSVFNFKTKYNNVVLDNIFISYLEIIKFTKKLVLNFLR